MYVNRCCNLRRQKCDQETSSEDFKILRPYNRNTVHVESKKHDTSNNGGNWNHLKIIQTVP